MIEDRLKIGDIVQHFKRETLGQPGNLYLYKILNIAEHTESHERLVIYQALYENNAMGVHFGVYARPYNMFMGKVDRKNTQVLNRNTDLKSTCKVNMT